MERTPPEGQRGSAEGTANFLRAVGQLMKEEPGDFLRRFANVVHGAAGKPRLGLLIEEVKDLVNKGTVAPGRIEDDEPQTALAEVVDDLANRPPDAVRWALLRLAFLGVLRGDADDPEGTKGILFVQLACRMSRAEALVLGAAYRLRVTDLPKNARHNASARFFSLGAAASGLGFSEPFNLAYKDLEATGLVRPPSFSSWNDHPGALTDYGLAFCEFLRLVEPFDEQVARSDDVDARPAP